MTMSRGWWGMGVVVALAGVSWWRPALVADAVPQNSQPEGSAAVRLVPPGESLGTKPGVKGSTYYALEGQTMRFTTRFVDGSRAVAVRGAAGDIATRLEDVAGNEVNRFKVDRSRMNVLEYKPAAGGVVNAWPHPAVTPTLDWSNQQSHRFYQDRAVAGTRLEWKNGLMRTAKAVPTENDLDVLEVETQWANGLAARTVRRTGTKDGVVLVTKLTNAHGVEIGQANYLVRDRIYIWNLPGVGTGTISGEHLKAQHGGWPFTPDMVWMNLQALGEYQWKSLLKEKGTVARQQAPRNRVLEFFAPTASANDAGCDSLHYLDGTNFRPCCDAHDRCYEAQTPACTQSSWWAWGSWACDRCNQFVWVCFYMTLDGHIRHPFGG
jgi:hypothetical protein